MPADRVRPSARVRRVEQGHKPGEVAKQLGVSRQTIYKWVRRHREEGVAGLIDRSSRPHRSPTARRWRWSCGSSGPRWTSTPGPAALSGLLGLPASTIGAVLRRWQLPHLGQVDRLTGEIVRPRPPTSATNGTDPASCCTSTSRSSAGSRTAVAGACTAAA
jgi:hypothetical protein